MPARVLEGLCPHVDAEEATLDVADLIEKSIHDDWLSSGDVPEAFEIFEYQFDLMIQLI